MLGPKEKKERTLGVRLQVKGERCQGQKCVMVRRPSRPGVHGGARQRRALSDFGRQLREKQKFKFSYGLDDRNLLRLFREALRSKGDTATKFLELLERRLDNVLFRLGFAPSRSAARQLVGQGHILINGVRVRSPGYLVRRDDRVAVRPESKDKAPFKELSSRLGKQEVPEWLAVDSEKREGRVLHVPQEFEPPFEVNLLVESFSK